MVGKLLLLVLFLTITPQIYAGSYYISPAGNDSNNGTSTSTPWKTFAKSWTVLRSADTLFLMDGTYFDTISPTINGTSNTAIVDPVGGLNPSYPLDHPERTKNYIFIRALNDGQAIIDGQSERKPVNLGGDGFFGRGNYFWIEGIIAKNSPGTVFQISSKNVVAKRVTGINASPYLNNHVFTVSNGGSLTSPGNVLIEDAIASGSGRKMYLIFASYVNIILRRAVGMHQAYWPGGGPKQEGGTYCGSYWQQTDNIEVYNWAQPDTPNNTIVENSIALGGSDNHGFNLTPNPDPGGVTRGNKFLGDISILSGMNYDGSFKAWQCEQISDACYVTRCHDFREWVSSRTGFNMGIYANPGMQNNLFQDIFATNNASVGLDAGPWREGSFGNIIRRATLVNNTMGIPPPKSSLATPGDNLKDNTGNNSDGSDQLTILDSRIPGTNYNGAGASFIYRYENGALQDGTNGNSVKYLWPHPMQDRILRDIGVDITGDVTEVLRTNNTPMGNLIPIPTVSPLPVKPITNLNPGKFNVEYLVPVTVTMSSSITDGVIRYTLNGAEPTATSPQYTGPITISTTTMLKAKTFVGSQGSYSRSAYYQFRSQTNSDPQVIAGVTDYIDDATEIVWPKNRVDLYGMVEDFSIASSISKLSTIWTKVSGPGTVTFGDANHPRSYATFSQPGTYTLRLSASDGQLTSTDDAQVTVWPQDLAGIVHTIPGTIQAENYRGGGEGAGFHNTNGYGDVWYRGGPVDIATAEKEVNNYAIENFWPGEWLAYNVNVQQSGTYTLSLRAAAVRSGGAVHVEVDNQNISGSIVFTSRSGNFEDYQNYNKTVTLSSGNHVLKLVADTPATNSQQLNVAINYLEFTSGSTTLPPPSPSPSGAPSGAPKPGDANGDNLVDGRDYIVWLLHYGQNVSGATNGDFDTNNIVDGRDYVVWLLNYGN